MQNREIKFRIAYHYYDGSFYGFREWGLFDESFVSPPSITGAKRGNSYQFTGLKDKKGKDIYEGDIIKCHAGHKSWLKDTCTVGMDCGAFGIYNKNNISSDKFTSFINYRDNCEDNGKGNDISIYLEVIGNIHQNPELI